MTFNVKYLLAEISQFIGGKSKRTKILNALKNFASTRYHLKNKGEMKSLEFTLLSKFKEISSGRSKKISFEIDNTVEQNRLKIFDPCRTKSRLPKD